MKIKIIQKINKFIIFFNLILFQNLNSFGLNEDSIKSNLSYNLNLGINFNSNPQIKQYSFDSLIEQKSGGVSLYVDRETAKSWEMNNSFLKLNFSISNNDWLSFDGALNFRKDIEAWYKDKNSFNIPFSSREVDINFPLLSKLKLKKENFILQIGRFPFSFNKNTKNSISLSGSPYDDAITAEYSFKNINFSYYVSSMNPWLHDYYLKDLSSEYFRQNSFVLYQQRDRVYNELYKTLVAHQIKYENNNFEFGILEMSMIGGKKPAFSELNPFTIWHNDYNDAFTNTIISFQSSYKNSFVKIYSELAFDDIISGMNESSADSKNIFAYLFGVNFKLIDNSKKLFLNLEAISVNPYFGNNDIPLLKFISRRIYYSNYRNRNEKNYGDMYFVDYPIGYYRGPDVKDFWIEGIFEDGNLKIENSFGWLRTGSITIGHANKSDDDKLGTDFVLVLPFQNEIELRNNLKANYRYSENLNFEFSFLIRKIAELNYYFSVGVNYNLPLLNN